MYWLGPTLVLALIVAAGIFAVVKMQPASRGFVGDGAEEDSVQNSVLSPVDMEPAQFLEIYLEALGGREVLTRIKTASFEGRLRTKEGTRNFQLLVREPDQGVLMLQSGDGSEEHYFLNGGFGWKVLQAADGPRELRRLSDQETKDLMLTCRVHDPLRDIALGAPGTLWSVRETSFDGVRCYQVDLEVAADTFVDCFLDKETLYPLATERSYVVDGKQVVRREVYGDYRMTSWVIQPFSSSVYHDGEFVSETEFRSIRMNADVDASLFEIPKALR
jgi:hypothetical protein